jgi:hypothetical protein
VPDLASEELAASRRADETGAVRKTLLRVLGDCQRSMNIITKPTKERVAI